MYGPFISVKYKAHDKNLLQIKDSFVEQERIFLFLDFTTIEWAKYPCKSH